MQTLWVTCLLVLVPQVLSQEVQRGPWLLWPVCMLSLGTQLQGKGPSKQALWEVREVASAGPPGGAPRRLRVQALVLAEECAP